MENARRKIPDFFKGYRPEYSSQRMRVPRAFLAQLDGPLPGEILLRHRMGRQWHVKVTLEAQDAYFEDGWQEFLRDNSVETNDYMVFSYQSPGVFRVVLYGHSACEKKECALPGEVGEGTEVQEHDSNDDDEDYSNDARRKIPDFFKAYKPEYSSQRMRVPRAFLAQLDGPLPGEILLRHRMGRQWHVKVTLEAQDAYFEDGWQEFLRDNSVETNDFMVFSYQSPGVFRVVLYGHSACEKKECALPGEVGEGTEVQEHDSNDDDEDYNEEEEEEEEDEGRSKRSKEEGNVEERKAANEDLIDVKRYIDPKNPYFVTVVQAPRSSCLYVPRSVLIDYKLKLPQAVLFHDPTGRTWRGTVKVWTDRRTWITGWGALCRHNNLKKNDQCICELLEENGVTGHIIKVHIVGGNST